jgi:hypothetical protein
MTEDEYYVAWCDIQTLVDNALGLAMLGSFNCSGMINDPKDQQLARESSVGATVILLKQARTLLEFIDPISFTFGAKETSRS